MRRLLPCVAALVLLAGCGGGDERPSNLKISTIATGLDTPWAIDWLPDGRALVTERPGRVRLLTDGKLQQEPVGFVKDVVETDGSESGLLGLAVDPKFADNGFVYLYLTTPADNEVVRFRFADDRLTADGGRRSPASRPARSTTAAGSRSAPTASSTSRPARPATPQLAQADGLNGKILRTADFRSDEVTPEVFTNGHRNVQGIDWEPGTDRAGHHRARPRQRRRGQRPQAGRRLRLAGRRRREADRHLRGRDLARRARRS